MFSGWTTGGGRLRVAPAGTAEAETFRIAWFAQVQRQGVAYWDLGIENGASFRLFERDVVELERCFAAARFELAGEPTTREPVEVILARLRAPTIERLVNEFVTVAAGLVHGASLQPLFDLAASSPDRAAAFAWLGQALVRKGTNGAPIVNDRARAALSEIVQPGIELSVSPVKGDMGDYGCAFVFSAADVEDLRILIDDLGRLAVHDGTTWLPVPYAVSHDDLKAHTLTGAEQDVTLGDIDRAIERLQNALEQSPGDPELSERLGLLLLDEGAVSDALGHLIAGATSEEAAVSGRAWFNLGRAHAAQGATQLAQTAFIEASSRLGGDDRVTAIINAATMESQNTGRDDGIARLHALTMEFPESADAWYGLGLSQVKAGRYDHCIRSMERMLAIESRATAHYTIACAYALRDSPGDDGRALTHVRKTIELDPELRADLRDDDDLASLRTEPSFVELVG